MARQDVRVQVILERISGLPEDQVVNVWSARIDPAIVAEQETLRDAIWGFYNGDTSTTFAVGGYMANEIVRGANAGRMKMYQLVQGGPDILFYNETGPFNEAAYNANDLPGEVALVTTLLAPATGTQSQARRRGRIYVGPLNRGASAPGTGPNRPDATFIATLVEATERAVVDSRDVIGGGIGVFSRVDHAVRLVESGYVDNAFDTQRRRGADPTTRTEWEI